MKHRSWAPLLCFAAAATVSLPAEAQRSAPEDIPATNVAAQTDDQRKAQEHFQRARELYQTGSYREAIAELEVARGLDPTAKDLVMNLGIVHEKLGNFDEAVRYFRTYVDMDGVTPAERSKAEAMVKRIEGAKREVHAASETSKEPPASVTAPKKAVRATRPNREPPARGRTDALTITAGSLAIAGLAAGAGFGLYALATRPSGFVTGRDGTYTTLEERTSDAHTAAVISDVSFGVGAALALATAWLYFARAKDASPPRGAEAASTRVSVTSTAAGGAVVVGGTF